MLTHINHTKYVVLQSPLAKKSRKLLLKLVVTIGDDLPELNRTPTIPESVYSQHAMMAADSTLLAPHTLLSPLFIYVERDKTLFHTPLQRCPIWTVPCGHTLPRKEYFHSPCNWAIFWHPVLSKPRLSRSPLWKKMAPGGNNSGLRAENCFAI